MSANRQLRAQYATSAQNSALELNPSNRNKWQVQREISSEQRPGKVSVTNAAAQGPLDYGTSLQVTSASQTAERIRSTQLGLKGGRCSIQSQKPPISSTSHSNLNGLAISNSSGFIAQNKPESSQPTPQGATTTDETSTFLEKSQLTRLAKLQADVKRGWHGVQPD